MPRLWIRAIHEEGGLIGCVGEVSEVAVKLATVVIYETGPRQPYASHLIAVFDFGRHDSSPRGVDGVRE